MVGTKKNGLEDNWTALYGVAEAQAGHFSAAQAAKIGYYPQRLQKHLQSGRINRVRRGIYRLSHFPMDEHEDLVIYWLWTEQHGVFSGETALNLHEISDALPAKLHISVPEDWQYRRLRIPKGLILHFADIRDTDWDWLGPVPVTTVKRTIEDCIEQYVQPDLIEQAIGQARQRGLIATRVAKALTTKAAKQ